MGTKYIKGLNGIRVLGLLGVILYHTFPKLFPGGFLGVVIFFVISGFLSSYSLNNEIKNERFNIVKYYKKRIRRIYPSIIIVLLWSVGVLLVLDPLKLVNTQGEVLSIIFNYNNYWQISKNADYFANLSSNSPFTHLWYISILMQFDLICPIICWAYSKLKKSEKNVLPLVVFFIISLLFGVIMPIKSWIPNVNKTVLYYQSDCRVFALLLGMWLGLLYSDFGGFFKMLFSNQIVALCSMFVYYVITIGGYLLIQGNDIYTYRYYLPGYTLLTTVSLVIVLSKKNNLWKLLDSKVSNCLSRYSFEIYLWQYPVLFFSKLLGFDKTVIQYFIQLELMFVLSIWLNMFITAMNKIINKKLCKVKVMAN